MKKVNNILVALDLSTIDDTLIQYASFLADTLKPEKIYFVHNIKKYEISEIFQEQLKDLDLETMISDELDEKVAQHFSASTEFEVLISEDPYTESLMSYVVHKYAIDLVIVGKKKITEGSGGISEKLMKTLKCDIVSVPENSLGSMNNIWVGTDFSRESAKSFETASMLANYTGAGVSSVHVYSIPIQFTPYIEKDAMLPKIQKHSQEKFDKFLKRYLITDTTTKIFRAKDASVAERLVLESDKEQADLLIIASQGNNVFSSLLVGSVAGELFKMKRNIPVWISK